MDNFKNETTKTLLKEKLANPKAGMRLVKLNTVLLYLRILYNSSAYKSTELVNKVMTKHDIFAREAAMIMGSKTYHL